MDPLWRCAARVDLPAGVGKDTEFLSINPAGFIPAIQDGGVTMVESIAIMEYLMTRYGLTPLAPDPRWKYSKAGWGC